MKSKKQDEILSETPSTKHRFYDFIDIMTNAIYDEYLKTSAIYNIFVEHPVHDILTLKKNVLRKNISKSNFKNQCDLSKSYF